MDLSRYLEALGKACDIVLERDSQGENESTPIEKSFLNGTPDLFSLIYLKIVRVNGRYKRGDRESIIEELLDIINYAAFAVAMIGEEAGQADDRPKGPRLDDIASWEVNRVQKDVDILQGEE